MAILGGRPPSGLLPDAARVDLDLAWVEREQEAGLLLIHGHLALSMAFRVYALDIRIKTIICKQLHLEFLPRACKTHDLAELVIFSGLWMELNDPANEEILKSWDILADFSKKRLNDIRYLPTAQFDSVDHGKLSTALDDPQSGVLGWLSRHP
jgi:hypothetical protein